MPKRPFSTNDKLIEVSYPLQLEIGHLINQFSEQQEPRIDYDLSIESFDIEEASIMPSSIPFKFDFDINKVKTLTTKNTTTVGNDTETVEVKIPLIGPSCTKFQLIYCVTKFWHASNTLQWTTGPKLFNKWKQILEDAYDVEFWDQHFTSNGFTETVDNFWDLIRIFIFLKFANNTDTYNNHKDYLLAQKKTREMSVGDFESLLRYYNHSVLPILPGAPADRDDAVLSIREFNALFYKAMPGTWRDKFEDFEILNTNNIVEIKTFMERQDLRANASSNQNK